MTEEELGLRPYVLATDFMKALHDAGLLPQYPQCSRVVIDATAGSAVQMFVDQIPSGALLSIPPLMRPAEPAQHKTCTPIPCPPFEDVSLRLGWWGHTPTLAEMRQTGCAIAEPDGSHYVTRDDQVVRVGPDGTVLPPLYENGES